MGVNVTPLISALVMSDFRCGDWQASAAGPDFVSRV